MGCPGTDVLQLLVAGKLAPDERARIADHAATCQRCQDAVRALVAQHGRGQHFGNGALAIGSVIGGRFRIDDVLGMGGMGIVVAATHLELGNRVAIKFMRDEMLDIPAVAERFVREARSVVQLSTEHVCKVFDVARLDNGAPYIVMELLQGVDLARTILKQPLPMTIAVEYVMQACIALAEAHAAGIVHRDLKPANLFVMRRLDGRPLIKVLDFGVAKAFNATSKLTHTSAMLGSPAYMSPEQLESARDVDARTDIWALGVTLYQLLSARLPFSGTNHAELAVKILTEAPAPIDIDPRLRAIVMHCLEKAPDRRYPDMRALVMDLIPFGGPAARWIAAAVAGVADTRIGLSPPTPPGVLSVGTPYPPTPQYAHGVYAAPTGATAGTAATASTPVSARAAATAATSATAAPATSVPVVARTPPVAFAPRRSRLWWIALAVVAVVGGNLIAIVALTSRDRDPTGAEVATPTSPGERIAVTAPADAGAAVTTPSTVATPRPPEPAISAPKATAVSPPKPSRTGSVRGKPATGATPRPATPGAVAVPARGTTPGATAPASPAVPGATTGSASPAVRAATTGSASPAAPAALPGPVPPADPRVASPSRPAAATGVVPESLSGPQMMAGLQRLEPRFRECVKRYRIRRTVSVTVTVSPEGRVAGLSSGEGGPLDQCLYGETRGVTFPATRVGGQGQLTVERSWLP